MAHTTRLGQGCSRLQAWLDPGAYGCLTAHSLHLLVLFPLCWLRSQAEKDGHLQFQAVSYHLGSSHRKSVFFTHSCCRVSRSVFMTGSHPESKATGWGRPHLNPRRAGYWRHGSPRETWYCLQSEPRKPSEGPALLSRVWWYHTFSPRPGHWSGAQPRCLKPMVFL